MRLRIVENKKEPLRSWSGDEDFNDGYRSKTTQSKVVSITASQRFRWFVSQLQQSGRLGDVPEVNELDAWLITHKVDGNSLISAEFVHDWVTSYRLIGDPGTAWELARRDACEDLDCCE